MDPLRYLLILAACVAVTLPLEFVLGARVYRRPRLLVPTLLPVLVVFVVWDLVATARGDWWFSEHYTLGPQLLGLPFEEWLFFLVVPVCALLTYEVLGRARTRRPRRSHRPAASGDRPAASGDRAGRGPGPTSGTGDRAGRSAEPGGPA